MKRGFSLVEVAIVLVIMGGIAAAAAMLGDGMVESAESQSTDTLMDTLEQSIAAYARISGRLPCPASEALAADHADFGRDTATPDGTCAGSTSAGGDTVRGVVPFQTLGVSKSLAFDASGHRFVYYVDRRVTAEYAFQNLYAVDDSAIGSITVADLAGGIRTAKAVLALVGHGGSAHGAVDRSGTRIVVPDAGSKELENADVDAAGTPTAANSTLVQGVHGNAPDGTPFDDVVRFYPRAYFK